MKISPAAFWSKLHKQLTRCLFADIKLLLEYREENIKGFLSGRRKNTLEEV